MPDARATTAPTTITIIMFLEVLLLDVEEVDVEEEGLVPLLLLSLPVP